MLSLPGACERSTAATVPIPPARLAARLPAHPPSRPLTGHARPGGTREEFDLHRLPPSARLPGPRPPGSLGRPLYYQLVITTPPSPPHPCRPLHHCRRHQEPGPARRPERPQVPLPLRRPPAVPHRPGPGPAAGGGLGVQRLGRGERRRCSLRAQHKARSAPRCVPHGAPRCVPHSAGAERERSSPRVHSTTCRASPRWPAPLLWRCPPCATRCCCRPGERRCAALCYTCFVLWNTRGPAWSRPGKKAGSGVGQAHLPGGRSGVAHGGACTRCWCCATRGFVSPWHAASIPCSHLLLCSACTCAGPPGPAECSTSRTTTQVGWG